MASLQGAHIITASNAENHREARRIKAEWDRVEYVKEYEIRIRLPFPG